MAGTRVQSRGASWVSGQVPKTLFFTCSPLQAGNLVIVNAFLNYYNTNGLPNPIPTPSTPTGGPAMTLLTSQPSIPLNSAEPAEGFWTWYGWAVGGETTISITLTDSTGYMTSAVGIVTEYGGVSKVLAQASVPPVVSRWSNMAYIKGPDPSTGFYDYSDVIVQRPVPTDKISLARAPDLIHGCWVTTRSIDSGVGFNVPNGFTESLRISTNSFVSDINEAGMVTAWRNTTLAGDYQAQWFVNPNPQDWRSVTVGWPLTGPAALLAGTDAGVSGDFGTLAGTTMLSGPASVFVPAAVVHVPDRWVFGGVDLSTFAYTVTRSIDADSHPARRGSLAPLPGRPGSVYQPLLHAGRIVTVAMFVWPRLASGAEPSTSDRVAARANLDALQTVLARGNAQNLVRVMPDGTGRQAWATVQDVQEIDTPLQGVIAGLTVRFYLPDPYWYTAMVVDGPRAISASPTTFTLIHPGTVPRAGHVMLEFLGPITNPRVTNQSNGVWVQYTGAVPNSQRLLIDSEHFSAYLAGASVIGRVTHGGGENEFLWIEPGTNGLVVTATTPGGTLTTYFSPPWM